MRSLSMMGHGVTKMRIVVEPDKERGYSPLKILITDSEDQTTSIDLFSDAGGREPGTEEWMMSEEVDVPNSDQGASGLRTLTLTPITIPDKCNTCGHTL